MDSNTDRGCWYCGSKLAWISDLPYDEVFGYGDGVVTYLRCSECGAYVRYDLRDDEMGE